MVVIAISLGTPQSAGNNFGCTWECTGAPATHTGVQMTRLGASGRADDKPGSAADKPGSISNRSRAVWEKLYLL